MSQNYPWLEFLLFLLIIFSQKAIGSKICRASFPQPDYALLKHVIRTSKADTFEGCTYSCELEPQCFSVNYVPLQKTCDLNQATREFFSGDFVKRKGAIYIDMVTRKYDPCVGMHCLNGGICNTSPSAYCACPAGFTGLHCEAQSALGMESGAILDKDIVASSNKPGYEPWKGRLHGRSCWMPSADKNSEYISVTLSGKVNITAIATQGAVTDRCWVTSYEIHYYDGSYFTRYPKVLLGNSDKSTVVTQRISFEAIYVRIFPQSWESCIAIRFELYGA